MSVLHTKFACRKEGRKRKKKWGKDRRKEGKKNEAETVKLILVSTDASSLEYIWRLKILKVSKSFLSRLASVF